MQLFDDGVRTDGSPAKASEDSFSFLNRAAGPFWATIRDELERWFADYPAAEAPGLRSRFRNRRPDQHWAAWWELYLFRLFGCLGFEVDVHPEMPARMTRPDFRLRRERNVYVEATTVFSGIVEEGRSAEREAWMVDALNEVKSTDFVVWLHYDQVGMERPGVREVTTPVEEWLTTLDADEAELVRKAGGSLPTETFAIRNWLVRLEALPRRPERRTQPAAQFVGVGPMSIGFVDDRYRIGRALESKKRQSRVENDPAVLAVLGMSPVLDEEDVTQALFGSDAVEIPSGRFVRQPDGFWRSRRGASGTGVSGVLVGSAIHPWSVAKTLPRLWLNRWATTPLEMELPFPLAVVKDEQLAFADATRPPHEVFGLPSDWPGDPDSRFVGESES
jgi:hypothetical protein